MFSGIEGIIGSQHVSGEAFFITHENGTTRSYKVRLEPSAEKELTEEFCKKLRSDIIDPNAGKTSVPAVSGLLERDKQVFEYDHHNINHLPPEFIEMRNVMSFGINNQPPYFDFANQSLSAVKGITYHLSDGAGNSVVLYQHKYPVSLHRKTKKSYFSVNGRTLDRVNHDSIDINNTIDFFYYSSNFYAINIGLLERFYGLEQVIDNLANSATPLILGLNVIDLQGIQAPQDIFKDMHKDRAFMRRLAMITNGNLIRQGVTLSQIQQVTANFPVFQRTIDLTSGLISLSTKEQKRYFIRLLNNEASFAALDNSPFLAVDKDSAS